MFLTSSEGKRQLDESLKPIHDKLNTHEVILEDYIKYKTECAEQHRRRDDKIDLIIETQKKFCEIQTKNQEFHEKNADNLQMLTDIVVTARTGRKSIPWVVTAFGLLTMIISGVVVSVDYIHETIHGFIKWK